MIPDYDLSLDELSVALSYVALGLGGAAPAPTKKEAPEKEAPKKAEKKAAKKVRAREVEQLCVRVCV